jgi:hypothetical protein
MLHHSERVPTMRLRRDNKGQVAFVIVGALSSSMWLGDLLLSANGMPLETQASPQGVSRLSLQVVAPSTSNVVVASLVDVQPANAVPPPSNQGAGRVSIAQCASHLLPSADDLSFKEGKRLNADQFCGCITRLTVSLPKSESMSRCYEVWAMRE